jgi:NADH:ubiquinone oxidoreductase subunit 4 (chain M)
MSNSLEFPWLSALVLLPLLAAFGIPLIPQSRWVRWYALAVGALDLGLMVYVFARHYDLQDFSLQLAERYAWVPQIGFHWSLAVDGLSFPLVLLSGLITTLAIVAAWNLTHKPRLFFFLLLLMYGAQVGVFLAQDLLLFFLMWEIELVPVYLLIAIWAGHSASMPPPSSSSTPLPPLFSFWWDPWRWPLAARALAWRWQSWGPSPIRWLSRSWRMQLS